MSDDPDDSASTEDLALPPVIPPDYLKTFFDSMLSAKPELQPSREEYFHFPKTLVETCMSFPDEKEALLAHITDRVAKYCSGKYGSKSQEIAYKFISRIKERREAEKKEGEKGHQSIIDMVDYLEKAIDTQSYKYGVDSRIHAMRGEELLKNRLGDWKEYKEPMFFENNRLRVPEEVHALFRNQYAVGLDITRLQPEQVADLQAVIKEQCEDACPMAKVHYKPLRVSDPQTILLVGNIALHDMKTLLKDHFTGDIKYSEQNAPGVGK